MTRPPGNPPQREAMPQDRPDAQESQALPCPFCGAQAEFLADSTPIYGRDFGPLYACRPCNARVGVHPGTRIPLGALANEATRKARRRAHDAFDALWRAKWQRGLADSRQRIKAKTARGQGYAWLAEQLGLAPEDCHIGMMDEATALRVVEVCEPFSDRLKDRHFANAALRAGVRG